MPIMTYEEYAKTDWKFPYCFKLSKNGKSLYFFGETHSYQDDDPQWEQLKSFWADFLVETAGHDRVVMTEGGVRFVEAIEKDAITRQGGMGLIAFLASQEGIRVMSPEPDNSYERSELEKEFSRDDIQYYYFARMVVQWYRTRDRDTDFAAYIPKYLDQQRRRSGWEGYDFSLDHMKAIHRGLFGKDFDESEVRFMRGVPSPVSLRGVTNRVSRRSGEIRDEYIAGQIASFLGRDCSVFIQYGGSHAVVLKPFLEELLDKNP